MPRVSVIIPTYNRAEFILRAVNSVLAQTYCDFETIVVDDGSQDDTTEVLSPVRDRIKYIRQENSGVGAARNLGIREADSEWIAFLDSDDEWLPEKLEKQMEVLALAGPNVHCSVCSTDLGPGPGNHRSSFLHSGFDPPIDRGICYNTTDIVLTHFFLFNQVLVARRETLFKVGLYNEAFPILEDMDLALRLSGVGPWAFLTECLVSYQRNSPNNLSGLATKRKFFYESLIRVYDNFLSSGLGEEKHHRFIKFKKAHSKRMVSFYEKNETGTPPSRYAIAIRERSHNLGANIMTKFLGLSCYDVEAI